MTANYTETACPVGYYCPEGTGWWNDNPCPLGTFSNVTHRYEQSQCMDCPGNVSFLIRRNPSRTFEALSIFCMWHLSFTGGYFCDSEGLSVPTDQCSAGYYCTLRANVATPNDGITGDLCRAGKLRDEHLFCDITVHTNC